MCVRSGDSSPGALACPGAGNGRQQRSGFAAKPSGCSPARSGYGRRSREPRLRAGRAVSPPTAPACTRLHPPASPDRRSRTSRVAPGLHRPDADDLVHPCLGQPHRLAWDPLRRRPARRPHRGSPIWRSAPDAVPNCRARSGPRAKLTSSRHALNSQDPPLCPAATECRRR
jgi:hypothetical protein